MRTLPTLVATIHRAIALGATRALLGLLGAILVTATVVSPAQASSVHFNRTHTLTRGPIHFGTLHACTNKMYMPVKDSDGNLRITGMGLTNNGLYNLQQVGNQHVGGALNEVAITGINGCNFFVTAVRTQNNGLKLISWFSGMDGFQRLGETGNNIMPALEVDATTISGSYPGSPWPQQAAQIITAVRMVNGHLALVSYRVNGGAFDFNQTEVGEVASQIRIVSLPPAPPSVTGGRVVVAYRNADQQLRLVVYRVEQNGTLTYMGSSGNQAGVVQQIALTAYDKDAVVTAVKTAEGNLRMIPWRIHDDGAITRLHGGSDPTFNNPNAGAVSEIDVVAYPAPYSPYKHVVTAVRTAEGTLKLIAWGIDGGDVVQLGNSGNQAGAATQIQVAWSQNNQSIVTSMRDGDGNLRVITWSVD